MDVDGRFGVLSQTEVFQHLDEKALREVARDAQDRVVSAGNVIYSQGESAEDLFVIAEGEVALASSGEDGERALVTLRPGAAFGEAALFDGGPRMVSARAVSDTELVTLSRDQLLRVTRKHHEVAEALLRLMAMALRRSTEA